MIPLKNLDAQKFWYFTATPAWCLSWHAIPHTGMVVPQVKVRGRFRRPENNVRMACPFQHFSENRSEEGGGGGGGAVNMDLCAYSDKYGNFSCKLRPPVFEVHF